MTEKLWITLDNLRFPEDLVSRVADARMQDYAARLGKEPKLTWFEFLSSIPIDQLVPNPRYIALSKQPEFMIELASDLIVYTEYIQQMLDIYNTN